MRSRASCLDFKPPPPAPIKPYKPVAVTPPAPFNDPGFVAFRKQLGDVAAHKDRAALAKLVVAQNFFWIQDKDLADKRKPGVDNLAKAIDLDAKDGSGWDVLTGFANEPSGAEMPQQKGVDLRAGRSDHQPERSSRRSARRRRPNRPTGAIRPRTASKCMPPRKPNAPIIEKLGMNLVRVLPDTAPPANPNEPVLLHVATPSGKAGFIDAQSLLPLGGDQMCYVKDASGWKIAGYLGGVSQ